MAECATIARPYAKALFDLALLGKDKHFESWLDELKTLAEIVMQPKVIKWIDEPEIGYERKAEGILSLLNKESVDTELKNFVFTLAQYKRLSVLPEIFAQFQYLALSQNHTKTATVYTAYALKPAQFTQIVTDMEARFNTKLKAQQIVEPDLIGGVKVEIGDQVLDLSVRGRLNDLRTALMN